MILDTRDTQLLRLAGRYRWLPYRGLGKYGFSELDGEVETLIRLGLMKPARSREYVRLSESGYDLLDGAGFRYSPGGRRAYSGSPTLLRRLQTVDIMLTCLRAGIDTLRDDVKALREQPVFYPAFALRPAMMNCASCAAFGHWGGTAYMIQYVSAHSPGMYRVNEFTVFHNLASTFKDSRDEPMAMLLAGESYSEVYRLLTAASRSAKHGVNGFTDFRDIYSGADMPIYLAACNETGARQLAVMRQPGYRAKIARSAYGEQWLERDSQIPEADGSVGGAALAVAVDMDVRRVERVVAAAKALGGKKVMIAAFEEQHVQVFHPLYKTDGDVTLVLIGDAALDAAFSRISLYNMDSAPAAGADGGAIHV